MGNAGAAAGYVDFVSGYIPRLDRLLEKLRAGIAGGSLAHPLRVECFMRELSGTCKIHLLDDPATAGNEADAGFLPAPSAPSSRPNFISPADAEAASAELESIAAEDHDQALRDETARAVAAAQHPPLSSAAGQAAAARAPV